MCCILIGNIHVPGQINAPSLYKLPTHSHPNLVKLHDPSYKLTTLQQIEKLFTIVSVYQAGPSIKNSKR
jgi:hypothetical protein